MKSVELLAPTYVQMLTALSAWLEKAQAQLSDELEGILSARLHHAAFWR